jgi:hypothetical protein
MKKYLLFLACVAFVFIIFCTQAAAAGKKCTRVEDVLTGYAAGINYAVDRDGVRHFFEEDGAGRSKSPSDAGRYDYLAGTYSMDREDCDFSMTLTIRAENGKYAYRLKTSKQNVSGTANIVVEDNKIIVRLPEVKWHEYKGPISEDRDVNDMPNLENDFTVNFEYDRDSGSGTLATQNYGNAMNHYMKFEEIDCKYIRLKNDASGDWTAYRSVFDDLKNQIATQDYKWNGVQESSGLGGRTFSDYCYLLRDINSDGVNELFLYADESDNGTDDPDYSLIAVFTITDGEAELLMEFWSRSRGYLTYGNYILNEWSDSADDSGIDYYWFDDNRSFAPMSGRNIINLDSNPHPDYKVDESIQPLTVPDLATE